MTITAGNAMSYLYKYRAIGKNSLEILIRQALFFSKTSTFNDPFDGQLLPSDFMAEMMSLGYPEDRHSINHLQDFVKERLEGFGVYSLSRKGDDILMWSHYADAHKGFCLAFTGDLEKKIENNAPIYQEDIRYEIAHPFKRILEDADAGTRFVSDDSFTNFSDIALALLDAALTVKHASWAYEQEVRIISDDQGLHAFDGQALDHVILGLNIARHDQEIVLALLKNAPWSHVRVFKAQRGKAAPKLDIVEISR